MSKPAANPTGFGKDARAFAPMLRAGFGFVECGTVTPLPQGGNPPPRMFRLPEDRAVVNRLGFNNGGLDAFAARLERRSGGGVVGANLGANKDAADRIGDYVVGFARVAPVADYVTVNVSSPNTPGLRALQSAQALDELGERLGAARATLRATGIAPPVFLKVAPDLDAAEIEAIGSGAVRHGFDALVVSNTTVERPPTLRAADASETGGLSGKPLFARSTAVLAEFAQALRGAGVALVGVGGVASGADAYAKIRAGAEAVQLYTALVYAGPGLAGEIRRDLAARLRADGFGSVGEAVGAG